MQHNNTATISRTTRTGSSSAHACAACKYQRRKCATNCILAPYFPQDRHEQFINALKLFGVGKITDMIKNMETPVRNVAMSTIQYQSDARALDPVGGCYRIIQELQSQIEYHKHELRVVLHQLAICRAQFSELQMMMPLQNQFGDPNFQEEISVWSDSMPLSSTLTLQDNKEEHVVVEDDDENDDQKHVLDLMKEMNSDKR